MNTLSIFRIACISPIPPRREDGASEAVLKPLLGRPAASSGKRRTTPGRKPNTMKELISNIAKALVDHPEMVLVTEVSGENTSVIKLSVAKSDIGMIIGKKGNTASAIRTLLHAAAGKSKKRYLLEIVE
jgi:predicted RNA-binding protein YlqC (UPF0109 family)